MNGRRGKTAEVDSSGEVIPWPKEGLQRVSACPACGQTERKLLHDGLTDRIFSAPGIWTLFECADCGSGYLDPQPSPKYIELAYQNYFTHEIEPDRQRKRLSRLKTLKRAMANGYRNATFGTNYKPAFHLGVFVAKCFPGYRELMDAESRCLMRANRAGIVLDVGCGNGDFLVVARALGWCARGLDPDPKAVEKARSRGLFVDEGTIEILEKNNACYNAITLSHVIEHVHDPAALLHACYRLLKPNGLLWLETPNLGSLGHSVYGRHWRGLEPPRHLILFNLHALSRVLSTCGFVDISFETPTMPCTSLAAASEALSRGLNPIRESKLTARAFWFSMVAQWRGNREPSCRELITLTAKKRQ